MVFHQLSMVSDLWKASTFCGSTGSAHEVMWGTW